MLQARSTLCQDYVWIDCFFYGFYLKKDHLLSFQLPKPIPVAEMVHSRNMKMPCSNMKRANTTRQHLECKVTEDEQGITVHEIPEMIDAEEAEHGQIKPFMVDLNDDTKPSVMVDYVISTGISGVQYVMKTLSEVWNKME